MGIIRHSLLNQEDWGKPAVIDGENQISYHALKELAMAVGGQLPLVSGGIIAIFLPNSSFYIAALYGVIMMGMAAFPLSTQLTPHEVAALLRQTSPLAVITSKLYRPIFEGMNGLDSVKLLYVEELPESEETAFLPAVDADADEPMLLLSTSGTTGSAKIVQLSEKNVAASTLAYIDKMDFEILPPEEIRLTLGTPFSSVYGLMVLTACIIKSIPIVVLKDIPTLDVLYRAAQKHKITHFEGGVSIGLLMDQMAGRPIPYDIRSFRYFGLAGSKISAAVLERLTQAYPGVQFWPGYGMTEAGPLIAKPDKRVNMEKLESVGTKIDCVTIMIAVNGSLTNAPNTEGEIVVKGPNVMLGYYKNQEETRKILKDGYLYTGDIGYLDEDGYLYVCGRKKNIIIVRGFNVHGEEVEACILNSGLVRDCAVYGETDAAGKETVCADIIPEAPLQIDTLRAYCREHLASYKQPQKIHVVDSIRKTVTGKTERA